MKILKSILFIFIAIIISSCSMLPTKEVIIYKSKPVYPPAEFISACDMPIPPNKVEYMNLNILDRETALTKYIIELLKAIKLCNNKITLINEWKEKQGCIHNSDKNACI